MPYLRLSLPSPFVVCSSIGLKQIEGYLKAEEK